MWQPDGRPPAQVPGLGLSHEDFSLSAATYASGKAWIPSVQVVNVTFFS